MRDEGANRVLRRHALDEGAFVAASPVVQAVPAEERDAGVPGGNHRFAQRDRAGVGKSSEEDDARTARLVRQRRQYRARICPWIQCAPHDLSAELRILLLERIGDRPAIGRVIHDQRQLCIQVGEGIRGERRGLDVVRGRNPHEVDEVRTGRSKVESSVSRLG